METKHELHPELKGASLEKVCEMAKCVAELRDDRGSKSHWGPSFRDVHSADLHYMLEYLRMNFDLVPKK
jgi:hypothetical protein